MEIDFDAHYRVKGFPAIAFYLQGYAIETETVDYELLDENGEGTGEWYQDYEDVEDTTHVYATMVGDDKLHIVSVNNLIKIEENEFCHTCGQIGCGH